MQTRSAEEIQESTERLLRDLRAVVEDGEELLKASVQDLSERGVAARERLASAMEAARDTSRRLQERAAAGVQATGEMIRENPYRALGIAFGVGLFAGMLLKRR
jgi:ElaB/YqjD/DUF883 family membrane-anchored ribosome-binding protein